MVVNVTLAIALLGIPVADLQGDWLLTDLDIREPGKDTWHGIMFRGDEPIWRVSRTWIEDLHSGMKVTKRVVTNSDARAGGDPTGIRLTDYSGHEYIGSYQVKDGKAVLTVQRQAPIPGLINTEGTKYMIFRLERPKPPVPDLWFQPIPAPSINR